MHDTAPRPAMSPTRASKARHSPRPRRQKSPSSPHRGGTATHDADRRSETRKTKFRFKKSKHRSSENSHEFASHPSKRSKSYHNPFVDDPAAYDDTYIPNVASWKRAEDQDAAFRESLFDAMADDEGAAFWEGVYGQPIHVYERPKGPLESMDDEEYAKYVREKMWGKSHQHIMEERARKQEERKEARKRAAEERRAWDDEEREQRKRQRWGRDEKKIRDAHKRWQKYDAAWEAQLRGGDAESIPWPVLSGRLKDVTSALVREFILCAPRDDEKRLLEVLKTERVRWHPDKAQQKWGNGGGLDEVKMKAITTVFQTVDALWTEYKELGTRCRSV